MRLSLIAAVARNGAIGRANGLLWNDPQDQRHFRAVTMGCPVVMGRKTWDSLPARFRPLPGRRNMVLTRNGNLQATGAETAPGLDAALALLAGETKVFVIGGADLYAQALPRVDEMLITEIDTDLDGDTFFPRWKREDFVETARDNRRDDDGTAFAFVTYERRTA